MKLLVISKVLVSKSLNSLVCLAICVLMVACTDFTKDEALTQQKNSTENKEATNTTEVADTQEVQQELSKKEATNTTEVADTQEVQQESYKDKKTSNQKKIKKTSSEYINSILPEARRIEKEHGIPIDLTFAIAREESGNGDYVIGTGNHFGLRCASDDCITLEKHGQQISYETCPDVSECFDIFANTVVDLTGNKPITVKRLYKNGYASSPYWVKRVRKIRKEVRRTLSKAGIEY